MGGRSGYGDERPHSRHLGHASGGFQGGSLGNLNNTLLVVVPYKLYDVLIIDMLCCATVYCYTRLELMYVCVG